MVCPFAWFENLRIVHVRLTAHRYSAYYHLKKQHLSTNDIANNTSRRAMYGNPVRTHQDAPWARVTGQLSQMNVSFSFEYTDCDNILETSAGSSSSNYASPLTAPLQRSQTTVHLAPKVHNVQHMSQVAAFCGTAGSPLQDEHMQRTNTVSGPPSDAANSAKIFHARTWSTRCCDSAIPKGGDCNTNLDFASNGIQSGSVDAVSLTRTVVLCVVTFF